MFKLIFDFPNQIEKAVVIGKNIRLRKNYSKVNKIVLTGMGGSAVGGDLLSLALRKHMTIPFFVSRNYTLPNWVNKKTLVICSSYSGNTEESIAAFDQAHDKGAQIIGITTGGSLMERMHDLKMDVLAVPTGLQPRAALALSFVPILYLLNKVNLVGSDTINELNCAVDLISLKRDQYGEEIVRNPTYQLAQKIYKTLPIIYGENEATSILAVRWKNQLSENAKMLAFHNELPEMNHNEIVGWENNSELINQLSVIWLTDEGDHPQTASRQEVTREIIGDLARNQEVVSVEGGSKVERLIHMIHFGDWVSFWCAILHGTDPTPVIKIDKLKRILSKKVEH